MVTGSSTFSTAHSEDCPLVTIAIPTRNRAALLARAAASAMDQTYPRVEVLVSDNASEDQTAAELDRLATRGVRILRQHENLGMVGNWNALLANAAGEYFVNLSDDDYLEPEFVQELVAEFQQDSKTAFAYAAVAFHDEVTNSSWQPALAPPVEDGWQTVIAAFKTRRTILPSFTMMRTADLRDSGGYDERYGIGADWAAWIPLAMRGMVRQPRRCLGHYAQHGENLSNNSSALISALLNLVELSDDQAEKAKLDRATQVLLRKCGRRWIAQQTAFILAKQIQLGRSRREVWATLRHHQRLLWADPLRVFPVLLAFFVLPRGAHSLMRRSFRTLSNK